MTTLPAQFNYSQATSEVTRLKKEIGASAFSLGQWIFFVKQSIPHGEFQDWLRYEVKIPPTTAYRYIRVSQAFDEETIARVGFKKVSEILSLPESRFKEELMGKAESMSSREVSSAIKDIKEQPALAHPNNEAVEAEIIDTTDADIALNANAKLLDALLRVDLDKLPDYYVDLFWSQLHDTPDAISRFMEEINGRRNR